MATIETVSAQIERIEGEYQHARMMLAQACTKRARHRHARRIQQAKAIMRRLAYDLHRFGDEAPA